MTLADRIDEIKNKQLEIKTCPVLSISSCRVNRVKVKMGSFVGRDELEDTKENCNL